MKNLLFSLLALSTLILGYGCPPPAPAPIKFNLDRPFSLQIGQTAAAADSSGFTIKFEKIAADSRCPQGVECITAGKADVVLTLTKSGESQTVTLPFTVPEGADNVTDFKGHTVRVLGVSPLKFKDKEIKPGEYAILLKVTETPPPAPQAKLDVDFALMTGEQIVVEDDLMYRIRLDSVAQDSRCPEGVQCIWAGRVDAVFSLMKGDSTSSATLSTGDLGKGGKGEVQFGPYLLKIKAVEPPKKQGPPISQKDYKATLVLTKQ